MQHSWSRVVEELASAGPAASLQWEGVTLTTHFQPIYGVSRPGCIGYEAFARAHDASGRRVKSSAVFDNARRDGRGVELDRLCRAMHLRNFVATDPGEGRLFLNVDPDAAVEDAPRAREFADLVGYYGLTPRRVCLEILELDCVAEESLAEAAAEYRRIGATLALDDFGLGRSNFDRLATVRPELVKLQPLMLGEAVGAAKARAMLPFMVELLRESGARIVIDGVESVQDALLAVEAGANFLQGQYLAAPSAVIAADDYTTQAVDKLVGMRAKRVAAAGGD